MQIIVSAHVKAFELRTHVSKKRDCWREGSVREDFSELLLCEFYKALKVNFAGAPLLPRGSGGYRRLAKLYIA